MNKKERSYKSFTVTTDYRSVVTITLNVQGRPMNVMDASVMSELSQIVRDLQHRIGCAAVIFRSAKESGFLAGADVGAIADLSCPVEAAKLIDGGQRLFDAIEWLPMPTISVIHGPCLGGGLEWALACDYRIARDNSSTKIGLPEIKLGLIPGWGGTQRLPKLIGLPAALSMILTGKHVSAAEAVKLGLIDRAISPDDWDDDVDVFVDLVLASSPPRRRHAKNAYLGRWIEKTRLGRALVFAATRRRIAAKLQHYPALGAAIRSVRSSYGLRPKGFMTERNEFIDLLATPTCRHLLQLFFARESARSLRSWTDPSAVIHEKLLRKIGVIGAGAMGAGIGQLAANHGYEVVLVEVDEQAADRGRERVTTLVRKWARHKGMSHANESELLDRIRVVTEADAIADADLVIEAIVEKIDVKQNLFRTLDRIMSPETILATNTSSLSVDAMANATGRGRLVAGLHFFNPVHKMELVEVVRAKQTDDATIARLLGFVRAIGKTPVVTADTPGFLVNRVLFPYLGEAVLMVAEGHSIRDLDNQTRSFGMPMGPLELLDQVGLDVAWHVARSLDNIVSGLRPVLDQLQMMVDDGRMGKKSGSGFYRYRNGKRTAEATFPRLKSAPSHAGAADGHEARFVNDSLTTTQRRLLYPMLTESIRCKEQGVVDKCWAIDLAMVLGTGFAPHTGGPLHVVDSIGQHIVHENLRQLQELYGDRFASPRMLVEMAKQNRQFFPKSNPQSNDHAVSTH
ncbi:3-hydroxyacyl-CoA dehydrogenase NAD-binding domain-containing protein [Novipirellula artificiosorum]|uniref:enoyl-CoA hydratase n=1 Tax=Novipirellula artificiosorum TaxID=2528016 RepID=A0A5C6E4I9_9BACT|nr:3-hydroxyacyl-CoA dehydrogenase NAD-binding domain-containing protein [Novipirellula artificiosorum]TWU42501.1 Fatty acid oxidation complex subunit alpha [Novipirellula artificiosorum]